MVADILPKWRVAHVWRQMRAALPGDPLPSLVEIPRPAQSQSATPFSSKKTKPKRIPAPG